MEQMTGGIAMALTGSKSALGTLPGSCGNVIAGIVLVVIYWKGQR